jgi:predicted DCC family thiol-disulfide oxidoreductase YuxK
VTAHPLLYDSDCGFCKVCVAVVLRWDREGRLRPVALGTEEANTMLAGMPEAEQMASWHLVEPRCQRKVAESATILGHLPEQAVFSGGTAFSPLFRLLPGGAPLALLTDRFPGAASRGYRWVADHRSAIGKPIPAATRRWADRVISEYEANSR